MNPEMKAALLELLRREGFSDAEIAWADENPTIRSLVRGFIAGWKAAESRK
jgi:hypothetical protein